MADLSNIPPRYRNWREELNTREVELETWHSELDERQQRCDLDKRSLHLQHLEQAELAADLTAREEFLNTQMAELGKQQEHVRQEQRALSKAQDSLFHERGSLAEQDRMLARQQVEINRRAADLDKRQRSTETSMVRLREYEKLVQERIAELRGLEREVAERTAACARREADVHQAQADARQFLQRSRSELARVEARDMAENAQSPSSAGWRSPASSDDQGWDSSEEASEVGSFRRPRNLAREMPRSEKSDSPHGPLVRITDTPQDEEDPADDSDACESDDRSTKDTPSRFVTAAQLAALWQQTPLLINRKIRRSSIWPAMRHCARHYQRSWRVDRPALPNSLPPMPVVRGSINLDDMTVEIEEAFDRWWVEMGRADQQDMAAERRLLARYEEMCKAG
ncbi:hypothetical protein TI39_contig318g00001 [Zymoseptoria brevis]|uniref:Uncharacterized protein n=1 Tax=Zymoseptoria brevis TaxID=1047168 RepID=A0A0F4GUE9_9PEZI|nr:hypothetical protein TI39_contig318g00001 [Zymoseptoria brevis]